MKSKWQDVKSKWQDVDTLGKVVITGLVLSFLAATVTMVVFILAIASIVFHKAFMTLYYITLGVYLLTMFPHIIRIWRSL